MTGIQPNLRFKILVMILMSSHYIRIIRASSQRETPQEQIDRLGTENEVLNQEVVKARGLASDAVRAARGAMEEKEKYFQSRIQDLNNAVIVGDLKLMDMKRDKENSQRHIMRLRAMVEHLEGVESDRTSIIQELELQQNRNRHLMDTVVEKGQILKQKEQEMARMKAAAEHKEKVEILQNESRNRLIREKRILIEEVTQLRSEQEKEDKHLTQSLIEQNQKLSRMVGDNEQTLRDLKLKVVELQLENENMRQQLETGFGLKRDILEQSRVSEQELLAKEQKVQAGLDPQKYKTAMCKPHSRGKCKFGQICGFAHSEEELRIHRLKQSAVADHAIIPVANQQILETT